ncbi:MAG: enoyl-CoA hydratase-related protein [Rhodospirillales bacterium]|jgi:methylglutaconyl-CoA hydratase
MSDSVVLKEVNKNGIAYITLNRPHAFNGYNEELLVSLAAVLDEVERDTMIRAVVLRGAGKHFSAGADVNWFKALADASEAEKKHAANLSTGAMRKLFLFPLPTIALVHNACFGGGVGYAAGCDVVIASEDARFAITEVRVGITPAPILPQVISAIGVRQARRYTLTAETFDVHEAKHIGLVHKICPVGGLDLAVEPVIDAILRSAPRAVGDTKQLISQIATLPLNDELADHLASISAGGRDTVEGIEGFSAFLAKRNPFWYEPE